MKTPWKKMMGLEASKASSVSTEWLASTLHAPYDVNDGDDAVPKESVDETAIIKQHDLVSFYSLYVIQPFPYRCRLDPNFIFANWPDF